jgi:mono/diheme cytochrome c family protein
VSFAFNFARMVRVAAWTTPCLALLLSGCDFGLEEYPASMTYPSRSDPIVVEVPGATPWNTIGPGQLDKHIANLKSLEGKTLDPRDLSAKERQDLETALKQFFGTPAHPSVKLDGDITDLKLDEDMLKKGSAVYRRHCMHCHGVSGDGRGPTGPWVNPTPRDYRQGYFKFLSTSTRFDDRKPRRQDLYRTLDRGIEGTSMPSFNMLEEHEKEAVISYVIHLSLRGETEIAIMRPLLDKNELDGTIAETVESRAGRYLKAWNDSNKEEIEPTVYPYEETEEARRASVQRGYEIFTDPKGNGSCIGCHVDFGRQAPFRFDFWGTLVRPANLTAGVYRGGRRPLDLYYRIRGGIRPSNMPAAELKVDKGKKTDQYWDMVNFLQALPYPHMLPENIKEEIYGTRREKTTEHASR